MQASASAVVISAVRGRAFAGPTPRPRSSGVAAPLDTPVGVASGARDGSASKARAGTSEKLFVSAARWTRGVALAEGVEGSGSR
jgi:hypothetical protein